MKHLFTALLLACTLGATAQNNEESESGIYFGMHAGATQNAPLVHLEFGYQVGDVVPSLNYMPQFPDEAMLVDARVMYTKYMLQPYIGIGAQVYSTDGEKDAFTPQTKCPVLSYGLRFQWRKMAITAGKIGDYKMVTIGLAGNISYLF